LQTPATPATWLLRIPEVFAAWENEILTGLAATPVRKIARDYHLVRLADPEILAHSAAGRCVSWRLPIHHAWPCDPRRTDAFIEKAAQALARKFATHTPQTLLVGALDPGAANRYFRSLAANLRGRTLQLFPPPLAALRDATAQDPQAPTLFCLVGAEGLFCGIHSPLAANGFHPGGSKFIRQNAPGTISRAGAKIAEALHHLQLHRPLPPAGSHWLELGASPGGMTAELLARSYQVTAVDRAPLDPRLANSPALLTLLADAATYEPPPATRYAALLSDMNGNARESIRHLARLSRHLQPGGIAIFTLKLPGVSTLADFAQLESAVTAIAARAGLSWISTTHLTYNRHEFTLFFEHCPQTPL
jgi:hypothetical protein